MSSQAAIASTTRDRLLTSGALLFARKGYGSVSIRNICEHANTSVSMIHHHFGNKQGLLDAVVATFTSVVFVVPMVLLKKEATSREDFRTRVEMLFETTLDAYIEHRSVVMVVVREQVPLPAYDEYMERFVSFLEDAKQKNKKVTILDLGEDSFASFVFLPGASLYRIPGDNRRLAGGVHHAGAVQIHPYFHVGLGIHYLRHREEQGIRW